MLHFCLLINFCCQAVWGYGTDSIYAFTSLNINDKIKSFSKDKINNKTKENGNVTFETEICYLGEESLRFLSPLMNVWIYRPKK